MEEIVVKYKLDNGLTVLLQPMEGVVSISAGLWIKAGSRSEKKTQQGYAHFIEHLLFKGTQHYTAHEIAKIVDRVGGQHNAVTSREYTCYYINVVSDYLEQSIDLMSDMYYRPLFDKEDILKEKNVIIEEIGLYEDTPDELIHDIFMESMLPRHPLGNRILGSSDIINKATQNKLLDFYNQFYQNDNCILAVAGKLDIEKTKCIINRFFSGKLNNNIYNYNETSPASKRIRRVHLDKKLEQVHFCIGVDGLKKDDEDKWALYILSTILGGSVSSRLFQKIREKEGLCYSIYSFHSSYKDRGIFGIYAGVSSDKFSKVINMVTDECYDILANGISEEELSDTKAYIKGNLALSLESAEVKMGQLVRNEITYGRHCGFNETVEQINKVTLDDVNRITNKLFRDKMLTLVSLGKLKKKDKDLIIKL